MNTTKLKKFAADARINLMDGVRRKLRLLGFDERGRVIGKEPQLMDGGTLWNEEEYPESFFQQWTALRDRLSERGVREVVEEAAYTWFNRMMAIRILTMNGLCEPILRFDPATGLPLLLSDARMGRVPEMSAQERVHFDKLMDDDNRTYDQFALLLTVWCHDNPIIRACFGSIHDYVELLLPDNILRPDGFLVKLNDTPFITEEDYKSAELIGWLYQFYISDRKDEVFAKKGKVEAEEIPAATQIFTPNWIVKYMVENTILPQVEADDDILEDAKYLVKPEKVGTHGSCVRSQKVELEDLKVADFACGSGHILNECFDLLFALYRAESYSRCEAIECIFTKNLTGIDIDLRAQQLATFALLLKACQKDSSFADAHCMPHVYSFPNVHDYTWMDLKGHLNSAYQLDFSGEVNIEIGKAFELMVDADALGSIIRFDIGVKSIEYLHQAVAAYDAEPQYTDHFSSLVDCFRIILALTDSYDLIVMNPPYMPTCKVEGLKDYAAKNYPDSKTDLFSVFMDVCINRLKEGGKYGMINMQSWMFLSSFESLRKKIIDEQHIDSLLHLGPRTFDELSGEVVQNAAFVVSKEKPETPGVYYRLIDGKNCNAKREMFLAGENRYVVADQKQFEKIPGAPIAYWIGAKFVDTIVTATKVSTISEARCGMNTGDNEIMLKLWFEVNNHLIGYGFEDTQAFFDSGCRYAPYNKGGSFRKWYGNQEYVIKFDKENYEILLRQGNHLPSRQFYFRNCLTWSDVISKLKGVSFRFQPTGSVFDGAAAVAFAKIHEEKYLLSLLNSIIVKSLAPALNPTLHFKLGDYDRIPLIYDGGNQIIETLVERCIIHGREDWDAHETSWDFQTNPLVLSCYNTRGGKLEDSVADYEKVWERNLRQLHANEEELNRQFIEIYGLQDELTPNVPLDEITILQQGEVKIENGELKWQRNVIIQQLISYIVGCYMGRYRLDRIDEKGLHIAHPEQTEEELAPYKVSFTRDATFTIDSDGIIPVLPQGAPFYDNLYNYVEQFVKIVWGETHLQENLNFIEKCLGKPLNDFLMKDLWKYHKKMYQNRPIYWEFASKKGAFRALVYAHRMDRFTVEVLRSKYLLPYIAHIEKKVANMESRVADLSTPERRELDALRDKTLPELREYADRVEVVALKNITFDLDDGIVKNHALFGDIVTKLK